MTWEQTVGGVTTGIVALGLGVLTYKRSRAVDAIAAQSGAVSETRAGTTQVIDGLNQLIDQLQDDNKEFRADIRNLTTRFDVITQERDECRRQLNRLIRRYGDGDTPGAGTPVVP
jgi:ABC-type transporter Mla subunit MlaD